MARSDNRSVLVVGIYLLDRENTAAATVAELSNSHEWAVEQRWLALGSGAIPAELSRVTLDKVESPVPKFILINRLLGAAPFSDYAHIVVVDDDIGLPSGFLDDYLRLARQHDFALCQPARTHNSYIDHAFVEQLDGIDARWTRFVEIGPLFSMRRDAASILLPFDEASPMGWGYDFVWPRTLGDAGLKLGIIDAVAIEHRLRKPVTGYSWDTANLQMQRYMQQQPHLSKSEAFFIVESYA